MKTDHHDKPHYIDMLQRIERETAGSDGSIVPQFPGDEPVPELMERNTDQRGHDREKNAQKIRKVKPFPYILYNADGFSLPKYTFFILSNSQVKNKSRANKVRLCSKEITAVL
jgi:hypothetical protein